MFPPEVFYYHTLSFLSVNELYPWRFLSRTLYKCYREHLIDESKDHQPYLRSVEEDNAGLLFELCKAQPRIPFREYDLVALGCCSKSFNVCLMFVLNGYLEYSPALNRVPPLFYLQLLDKLYPKYPPNISRDFQLSVDEAIELIESGTLTQFLDRYQQEFSHPGGYTLHSKRIIELTIQKTRKYQLLLILNRYIPHKSIFMKSMEMSPDIVRDKVRSVSNYRSYLDWMLNLEDLSQLKERRFFEHLLSDYVTARKGITSDILIFGIDEHRMLSFHPYVEETIDSQSTF